MTNIDFFSESVGVFQGFSNSGLEFHADIMLPYQNQFQVIPMHGAFLLVELENEDEAVIGRISSLQSMGRLAGANGAEYSIRSLERGSPIPEDIRKDHLRYKVDIRVLGVLRKVNGGVAFAPSHRRLPHVGSRVAFPNPDVLKQIACDSVEFGVPIGHLALGEYIYGLDDISNVMQESWHKVINPVVKPRFDIKYMVSRKTFIFARAGYGKSNLNKLLFSQLYGESEAPFITWSKGEKIPIGTIIFDPEGEYFWPDSNGRPGLCDVPQLKDRLLLITDRVHSEEFYNSFKLGPSRLDLARLSARDALNIGGIKEEKWGMYVSSINQTAWSNTVEAIRVSGQSISIDDLAAALGLQKKKSKKSEDSEDAWEGLQNTQLNAARRELHRIVSAFDQPGAVTLEGILEGLRRGMIVIFDLSQIPPNVSETLTKRIMLSIFKNNQDAFTSPNILPIPTIAVIEEAQTVLGGTNLDENDPIVAWVKEGRKYNLGAVLITQQPGAISEKILSQGDNWFVFHLVSGVDLSVLKKSNGHFSDDLLQSLLNEPIKGQGLFWSSESPRSYPLPIRILPFETAFLASQSKNEASIPKSIRDNLVGEIYSGNANVNPITTEVKRALDLIKADSIFMGTLRRGEMHTNRIVAALGNIINDKILPGSSRFSAARGVLKEFISDTLGQEGVHWHFENGQQNDGKATKFIRLNATKPDNLF